MVEAIVGAIKKGGLFAVDVDIVPTKIGQACHVWLPAATSGEMNLTSMNGERRMRLTERYMDPPGQAMPDCLIAARIANNMERVFREMGKAEYRRQVQGLRLEDRRRRLHGRLSRQREGRRVRHLRPRCAPWAPTASRSRRPASRTARSSAPSASMPTASSAARTARRPSWRRSGAACRRPASRSEKKKFAFLINNGRTNHVWQSAYLDQQNEFVMDRWPYPFIQMNPDDMAELGRCRPAIWSRSTTTTARPRRWSIRRRPPSAKQTFMLFAYPTGVQGNVVNAGVNEFIIPNYKQTWGNIRKIAAAPGRVKHLSFRSFEYSI